jgi:transcriptional regulator with XRE-family HTH domain
VNYVVLLNNETFGNLRLREGLSRRALAKSAGVSETVISGIERRENHRNISLGTVKALADALGSTISELARLPYSSVSATPDDAALEAALASLNRPVRMHEVALALGWELERTRAAAASLTERLNGTGQTLIHTSWDQLRLAASDSLTHEQRLRLSQSSGKTRGLTPRTARVLRAFLEGEVDDAWLRHAGRNDRAALSALVNAGILTVRWKPCARVFASAEFSFLEGRRASALQLVARLDFSEARPEVQRVKVPPAARAS